MIECVLVAESDGRVLYRHDLSGDEPPPKFVLVRAPMLPELEVKPGDIATEEFIEVIECKQIDAQDDVALYEVPKDAEEWLERG